MRFRDLPIGARFRFKGEYGDDHDWNWNTKNGERTYVTRTWKDGSGGDQGRVGVGDQPVTHVE